MDDRIGQGRCQILELIRWSMILEIKIKIRTLLVSINIKNKAMKTETPPTKEEAKIKQTILTIENKEQTKKA